MTNDNDWTVRELPVLTLDEMLLCDRVWVAWGERDLVTYDNVEKLVAQVACATGASADAATHVLQYITAVKMLENTDGPAC